MPLIDTPLLIVGNGPAALVAAKVVSGHGLPCLIAGHEPIDDAAPIVLDERSLSILEPHGVLGVLRPYATAQAPFTIAPVQFEHGLKHHCVADMLVTVYDAMSLEERAPSGDGVTGILSDGRTRWELRADAFLDASCLPSELNDAIHHAADFAGTLISGLS